MCRALSVDIKLHHTKLDKQLCANAWQLHASATALQLKALPTTYITQQDGICLIAEQHRSAAIALESCAMAAIHEQVFACVVEKHAARDLALQAFLGQLLGGQYTLYGTSPDMQVKVSEC